MAKSKVPPMFHACFCVENVFTREKVDGFCVQGRCNSADLFVTKIAQKCPLPKNADVRLRLLRVVNMDAQGDRHAKKRRKPKKE